MHIFLNHVLGLINCVHESVNNAMDNKIVSMKNYYFRVIFRLHSLLNRVHGKCFRK